MSEDEGSESKTFRLPRKLLRLAEEDAKIKGKENLTIYTTEALEHFLKCRETEVSNVMKLIILKYDAKCLKCKHTIEAGSYALYGRGLGAICLDCHVERVGDKTTVAKYLRNRELDKVTNALKREADTLAERVEVYRTIDKIDQVAETQKKIDELVEKYLKSGLGRPEEQELLLEIKEQKKKFERLQEEVRRFIDRYLRSAKWIKRKKEEEYAT